MLEALESVTILVVNVVTALGVGATAVIGVLNYRQAQAIGHSAVSAATKAADAADNAASHAEAGRKDIAAMAGDVRTITEQTNGMLEVIVKSADSVGEARGLAAGRAERKE